MDQHIKLIANYFCRIICHVKGHTQKSSYKCRQCGLICNQCKQYVSYLNYIYILSHNSYCLLHYQSTFSSIIHYWSLQGKSITIYDPNTSEKKTIQLSRPINSDANSISFCHLIYLLGGYGPITDDVFELNILTKNFVQKHPMPQKKCGLGLCIAYSAIYVVGGYDNTWRSDCQKYSMYKNKWQDLPNLINKRAHLAAFSVNGEQVFALGGYDGVNELGTIESIRVANPRKWNLVNLKDLKNIFLGKCGMYGVQISSTEVLVFGDQKSKSVSSVIPITI